MHGTLPVSNPAAMPVHRRAAAGSNFFRWASSSAVAFTRGFMRCRKCGYTNPDNMRFCWACNENLNNPKYLNSFDYECIPSFFSNAILWAFLIASILLSFDKLLLIHIPFDGRDANPYFLITWSIILLGAMVLSSFLFYKKSHRTRKEWIFFVIAFYGCFHFCFYLVLSAMFKGPVGP